jgi:glycerol-3-phosphate dehydrogenase (NAD(P)+)
LSRLAILGAGSWGTALAIVLSPRFEKVSLWAHAAGLADEMTHRLENPRYLPGCRLPPNVSPHDRLAAVIETSDYVLLATPSKHLRTVLCQAAPFLSSRQSMVSATKGLEAVTLKRASQVIAEELPFSRTVAVISGPTFARDVAAGQPTALVVAAADPAAAADIQLTFSGPSFRLYTNTDVAGVELGASLKNVIAIAAGIVSGLGLGHNTLAALITRGLAEISRLAVALGGSPATLAGLAGLGDLVLTCTGDLSRNRQVGLQLAQGCKLQEILAATHMVAEGVETTFAARQLAAQAGVEMPIVEQMCLVLRDGKSPNEGIRDLMERTLTSEMR